MKINEMDNEEAFALQWLNTYDIYETLNPSIIEEIKLQKMSSTIKDKGKAVVVDDEDEEEVVYEEQFQRNLLQAKMISRLQTSLPDGKPSIRFEE